MIIDRVLFREEKASPNAFSIFWMQLYARLCKNKLNAIHFNATSEKDHTDRGNFQNIYRVLSQALLMQRCKKPTKNRTKKKSNCIKIKNMSAGHNSHFRGMQKCPLIGSAIIIIFFVRFTLYVCIKNNCISKQKSKN